MIVNVKQNRLYEEFRCLPEDEYFINKTDKDVLLVYPDGRMTIGSSKLKYHENYVYNNETNEVILDLDNEHEVNPNVKKYIRETNNVIAKKLDEMTCGNSDLVQKFYFGANSDEIGEYNQLPRIGKPILVKSTMTFAVFLYDDQESIYAAIDEIVKAGGPRLFMENFMSNEYSKYGIGIQYINFSPYDLFYASHDRRQVVTLPHMTREEALAYIRRIGDYNIYDNFAYDLETNEYIILGVKENGKLTFHRFEKEENCELVNGSIQYYDDSRRMEILPIFYNRGDAEVFLQDYDANTSALYMDMASEVADDQIEDAVHEEVVASKKNMTAVAKVCTAMVTTGLCYGAARTLIEVIVKNRKKSEEVIRAFNIKRAVGAMNIMKPAVAVPSSIAAISTFGTIKNMALGAAATGMSISAGPVIAIAAGAAVVIGGIVACATHQDEIDDFSEDHPIIGTILKGIGTIGRGIAKIGSFIKEGICKIGRAIGDFFSNLFG